MDRMVDDWDEISFNTTAYRDSGISILTSIDDIQTNLDDQIVKTQTMRGSPFIKPFEERIKGWEARLLKIQDTLDEWLKVGIAVSFIICILHSFPIPRFSPSGCILNPSSHQRTSWLRCLKKVNSSNRLTRHGRR